MPPSYLIVARTSSQSSHWTQAQFEADYRDNHLPRNVHHINGIHTGLRFTKANLKTTNTTTDTLDSSGHHNENVTAAPNNNGSYDHDGATMLALYTLSDPSVIGGPESQARRKDHFDAGIVSDVRLYRKVDEYEPDGAALLLSSGGEVTSEILGQARGDSVTEAVFGKVLVSTRYDLHNQDATLKFWEECLKAMSLVQGYRRSTCWEVTDGGGKVSAVGAPRLLILHEFDAPLVETSQRALLDADKVKVENIWQLVQVEGIRQKL
ncbi:hypothetical protein BD289DRAFT_425932 [Coniella lustricola]|uniref:EthD domain-containing protein n=1 Tax=Coniella lustricola TaxID=2025994 RepID=A0A2T3AGT0_9PEZI|nr:hypothetical protein BD289DRAFT_425932 [Coniella lustricola]